MNHAKLYTKHIFTSFLFLVLLVLIIFISSGWIKSFLADPARYFTTTLPASEISFLVVFEGLVVIVVLVSFIFYLLLTFHSRFKLQIWQTMRPMAFSQEQFRKLYDNAPIPYIMLGKSAEVHEPNKAALRFFGVVPEEIESKNFFSYIGGESKEQAAMFFEYYKTGVSIDRKEVEMVTKSGAIKTVLLSVFVMKNLGGSELDSGLAMIFDITEERRLDKAKTEFLSLATHQLRTPLAATKWYTEMLTSGDLGELSLKQREYITKLGAVNKDMIDLSDELLNVSRMEMGTVAVDLKDTNVEELTESVLVELSALIEKKKIKINKNYNDSLRNIKSDPRLLRIVVQNIVSNAVKYTGDEGEVSITFEESNNEKKIIVSDTGIGIPEADQARIFSKLFRAGNARSSSTSQGTGLGLYLVKPMIESMGGSIRFTSEENKGSTFTILL